MVKCGTCACDTVTDCYMLESTPSPWLPPSGPGQTGASQARCSCCPGQFPLSRSTAEDESESEGSGCQAKFAPGWTEPSLKLEFVNKHDWSLT